MRIGIAADPGGFGSREDRRRPASRSGVGFGVTRLANGDDFPDFVTPLTGAVFLKTVGRGLWQRCGRRDIARGRI
jgi:hypothetical protein